MNGWPAVIATSPSESILAYLRRSSSQELTLSTTDHGRPVRTRVLRCRTGSLHVLSQQVEQLVVDRNRLIYRFVQQSCFGRSRSTLRPNHGGRRER